MELPKVYTDTAIYQQLLTIGDTEAINMVDEMIKIVTPYLELVGREAFDNFTVHTAQHSLNLMGYASEIIPSQTLMNLSSVEIMILIYSFYIHDIGMAMSYKDCEKIYKDEEFRIYIESHPEYVDRLHDLDRRKNNDSIQPELDLLRKFIYQSALTEFLRPKHADVNRYQEVTSQLLKNNPTLFTYKGISFLDELILICHSHNSSAIILSEKINGEKRFDTEGLLCNEKLNMQFCAAVLRLCDFLDFDRERAPKSLYNAIGIEDKQMPKFKVSVTEWQKQMGIHSVIFKEECILIAASCQNPNTEHAIRTLCKDLELEIRDTLRELEDNKAEIVDKYRLKIPLIVIPKIKSENYVYKDYSIKLNDNAIIKLLMGGNLYDSPKVAARELLQNAIDACIVRKRQEKLYTPQIKVSYNDVDEDTWLIVSDNGIGMDEYVLSNYFLKVGNSYYSSSEFKSISIEKGFQDFKPISRFGIGFLSVFMIGDVVKVQTRNKYSKYSTKGKVLYVDNSGSLAIVQECDTASQGTTIEIKLKKEFATEDYIRKIIGHIKEIFIRPAVPIDIEYKDQKYHIEDRGFLSLNMSNAAQLDEAKIRPIRVDFSKGSPIMSGFAYFLLFEDEKGKLSYYDASGKYEWDKGVLKKEVLFTNVDNMNQVTINGIRMQLSKLGSMFNYKKKIMPYAIDINVISDSKIVFDVSRQRVIGKGISFIRNEILRIIFEQLEDNKLFERFTDETHRRLNISKFRYEERKALNDTLLQQVEEICPAGNFAVTNRIIKDIARVMEVDPDNVSQYVYAIANKRK